MIKDNLTLIQIIRYSLVGVAHNSLGYVLYLLVTWLWLEPKMAVVVLYPIGVTVAYFAHARFSFEFEGKNNSAFFRYLIANTIGFSVNILLLFIFVDILSYPHQFVQAGAIVFGASLFFLLSKYFVFTSHIQ